MPATAIVSDLHLGTVAGLDVLRGEAARRRFAEAVAPADRVVFLGDLIELRERPAPVVLEEVSGVLGELGEAVAGKQVVIVPGNHDYELIAPQLGRARLAGGGRMPVEATFAPIPGELSGRVADLMPEAEVVLGYPGVRLRRDVYATHGHYLDLRLTVPRVECVLASAIGLAAGRGEAAREPSPDLYEAALAPLYAFAHRIAQNSDAEGVSRGGATSRDVWAWLHPEEGRPSVGARAFTGIAAPAAVGLLNALRLGPFRADLSAVELRRAGLRAMAQVAADLGVDDGHVIFGHTHRGGPADGEVEGWWLPGGGRLTNTGSWLLEDTFVAPGDTANPYWPGRVTWVREDGPPEQQAALGAGDVQAP